jgi:hypothetical protein
MTGQKGIDRDFKWALRIFQMAHIDGNVCFLSTDMLYKYSLNLSVQKIKHKLVRKAELHKELTRARKQEAVTEPEEPASLDLHPDRQALIDAAGDEPKEPQEPQEPSAAKFVPRLPRQQWSKPNPYARESQEAKKRREDTEAREQAYQKADLERKKKMQDRDRMRRAVANARKPGRDGKKKLGREGAVLLEKIKKMIGDSG